MSLSSLERLPTELIQPIFLLSGPNLALPLASHHIAAKLSEEYIYHEVCTHYLTQSLEPRCQQSTNQTRIFATKWMTWGFFQSFLTKTYQGNGCLCGKTPQEGCFDGQWPPDFGNATTMVFSRSHLPALSYVKCRIPVKLLRGPWTQDKIQFLRFLLWTSSMTVDWAEPDVRQVARRGKEDAILERNLEVVELFNHNRRLGKAPSLATVRFAVMEGGCDRSIVHDIMATARTWGLRGDAWECPKLDAWCEERIKAHDPKGKWLQLKLHELRTTYNTGNAVWNNEAGDQGLLYGAMDPKSGDYDGGEDDMLIIHKHKWNEAPISQGWYYIDYTDIRHSPYVGLHGIWMRDSVIMTRSASSSRSYTCHRLTQIHSPPDGSGTPTLFLIRIPCSRGSY